MDPKKTMFADLREQALDIVRVQTGSSTYLVAFHEERGRKSVVVRGLEGSDREYVVVRDSDPRIGDQSLFDVPFEQWAGKSLEVATMRTSPVVEARRETLAGLAEFEQARVALSPPAGVSATPRIQHGLAQGTHVVHQQSAPVRDLAHQVVVGQGTQAQIPYPLRHVRYAEDVVALLRSIHRREQLFQDVAGNLELQGRLTRALEDATALLLELRQRRGR